MLISAGMGTLYPPGWAEYPLWQGVFKQRLEWGVSQRPSWNSVQIEGRVGSGRTGERRDHRRPESGQELDDSY